MPGRIGPLLTTGVALSVAAVVVANPVIAPRADLQVPAVKLSGTGDALDMLNNDFLNAIAPAPTESSTNPFAVLKDLITSLAADATYLTRNAIVSAFFAGATAVTSPELTAASYPYFPPSYVPPAPMPGGPAGWVASALPIVVPGTMSTEQLIAAAAALPAEVVPIASQVVMTLIDDVEAISDGSALTAAFAAGALLVGEGGRAIGAVAGLVDDGVQAALRTVLAVVGSGDPAGEIIDVLRGAIEPVAGHRSVLPAHGEPGPVTEAPLLPGSPAVTESPVAGTAVPAPPALNPDVPGAERIQRRKAAIDSSLAPAVPAAEPTEVELPEADGEADHPGPQTAAPARVPVRFGQLKDAVAEAREQAHGVLRDAADAVRKAADNAAKTATGPTRD